jgi:hypothetical protein
LLEKKKEGALMIREEAQLEPVMHFDLERVTIEE